MSVGAKRTLGARISALLSFVCGFIGLYVGLTDRFWKLGSIGWFTGGAVLALIALFLLVDGALASQKAKG